MTKRSPAVLAAAAAAVFLVAGAGSSGGSRLSPVGARQPSRGATLSACDPAIFAAPGDTEGACEQGGVAIVTSDRKHAVALKSLTLDVVKVTPVTRIRIGNGSIGPLDPTMNAWFAIKLQVKNTSGRAVQLRDEQFSLRLGTTRYPLAPEATSSEPDSLTRANHKLRRGKAATGTVIVEIPVSDVQALDIAPTALLFTGPGGDFAFNEFPSNAVGAIRLYK
jgi:hypothetical protein